MFLEHGKRYSATISLSFWKRIASNGQVADKLKAAGFEDVEVNGSGSIRFALGIWGGGNREVELPPEVSDVTNV